jgi:tetratricopeptide (TPR) repeat protein
LFGILGVMAALAIVGTFLSYHFRAQRLARAQQHYAEGNRLMANRRFEEAVEQYRDALSTTRTALHREALAIALEDSGRLQESAIYYDEVLHEKPDDGPANLGLARVDAALGQIDAALPHFQRAVYAQWPDHPRENRTQARIDMVNALAKAGRATRARAEALALALAADLPGDPATKKQVAAQLSTFALYEQAANVLRDVVHQNPYDAQAQTQFGQALLDLNDIAAADAAFDAALKADPEDQPALQGKSECDRIQALDPGARGLRSAGRYTRSRDLLAQVEASCVPPEMKQRLDAALAAQRRPDTWSDAAQDNQRLALEAWASRAANCASAPDPVLPKLMSLIAAR